MALTPTPTAVSWRKSKRVIGGCVTILSGAGTICSLVAGSNVWVKAAGVAATTLSAAFTTWFLQADSAVPITPPTAYAEAKHAVANSQAYSDVKDLIASIRESFRKPTP